MLFYSINFPVPGILVAGVTFANHEGPHALVFAGSVSVVLGAHLFVMTLHMLIKKVRVKVLCERYGAN